MMRPAEATGTGDLRMSVTRFFLRPRTASDEDPDQQLVKQDEENRPRQRTQQKRLQRSHHAALPTRLSAAPSATP